MLSGLLSRSSAVMAGTLWLLSAVAATAQNAIPGLDGIIPPQRDRAPVSVFAQIVPGESAATAQLQITAAVEPTFHIYSLTQKPGGPLKSRIELVRANQFEMAGDFHPSPPPRTHIDQETYPNLPLEEHEGKVTWAAAIRLPAGVAPESLVIEGKLAVLACQDRGTCNPLDISFVAKWTPNGSRIDLPNRHSANADAQAAPASKPAIGASLATAYRAQNASVVISGHIEPRVVVPGGKLRVTLTAIPDEGWHTYAWAPTDPKRIGAGKPTLIGLDGALEWNVSEPKPDTQPFEKTSEFAGVERYHEGTVSWTVDVDVPNDAAPGTYDIVGLIGYQVCYLEEGCKPPLGANFAGQIEVGSSQQPGSEPLAFSKANYSDAAKLSLASAATTPTAGPMPTDASSAAADETSGTDSFLYLLFLAFIGGCVLNVMPCVLPVIGLKVFAFIEQAGDKRSRVFALNVAYSLGVISVFWILAALATFFQVGWGQLFQNAEFNIAMAAVIFMMGLSFIGIWEIPIPGFVGSNKVSEIGAKEGYEGAFAKGTITTLLATPCTGPFMGTALVGLVSRPPVEIFSIFTAMGLGMASPYLLLGLFPGMIKLLPKPGMWMETFKQIMGFVLIGTVVYLLAVQRPSYYVVPTVGLLFGLWAACWWIGKFPLTVSASRRWQAVGEGVLVAAVAGVTSFYFLAPWMQHKFESQVALRIDRALEENAGAAFTVENIPWQPYTDKKLQWLLDHDKTVMVDFTADWCPNCHYLEKTVLRIPSTQTLVDEMEVYTLMADWTERNDAVEVTRKLEELQAKNIPMLAIYPAGKPDAPIIVPGIYQAEFLHEKLREAGPSAGPVSRVARQQ